MRLQDIPIKTKFEFMSEPNGLETLDRQFKLDLSK